MIRKILGIFYVIAFTLLFSITSDAASDYRTLRSGGGIIITVPAKVYVNEWFTVKVDTGSFKLRQAKFITQSGYYNQYFPSDYIERDLEVEVNGFSITKQHVAKWEYYRWIINGLPSSDPIDFDIRIKDAGRILYVVELNPYGGEVFTIDAICNYGPENLPLTFSREKGKPNIETIQWESCGGSGVISINGNFITSAHIFLNGQLLLDPSCFNRCQRGKDSSIKMDIELINGTNTLDVEISGKPQSQLQIDFEKKNKIW